MTFAHILALPRGTLPEARFGQSGGIRYGSAVTSLWRSCARGHPAPLTG
jgi:hypothetical protein